MPVAQPKVFISASRDLGPVVEQVVADLPDVCELYSGEVTGDLDSEAGVGAFSVPLQNAHLYLGVVSEAAQSIHPYSAGEASQVSWEVDLARRHHLDIRLFRKSGLARQEVRPDHAAFIEAAERRGEVEVFTDPQDLAVKVRCALRLWLHDYWRLILTSRRNDWRKVNVTCAVSLAVAAGAVAAASMGDLSLGAGSATVLAATLASLGAVTVLE